MVSTANQGLLVLIPGFGPPHVPYKMAILKNNLNTLAQLVRTRAFSWIHLTLCVYDIPASHPDLLNELHDLFRRSEFSQSPMTQYQIHVAPGVVGQFMRRHAHPDTLKSLNLTHILLLLDDVELPAADWNARTWKHYLRDYQRYSLNILSPTLTPDSKILFPHMVQQAGGALVIVSACEMFCYFMDLSSWRTYYAELSEDHPLLWGIDLVLYKHLKLRVGMAHYAPMRHYYQSAPIPGDPATERNFKRMSDYLAKFGETQASLSHQKAILEVYLNNTAYVSCSMDERYFILDDKNHLLLPPPDFYRVAENGAGAGDDDDGYLGIADIQTYIQLRSFVVYIYKPTAAAAKDREVVYASLYPNTQASPTALLIPYVFQLKSVRTLTAPTGTYQVLSYVNNPSAVSSETPYLNMVRSILTHGESRPDRTGTGTVSVFGHQVRFDISETVPLLTTKFVPWRSCLHELLWFLKGRTDSRELEAVGVPIWKGNTRREFLDQRGLKDLPEGDIGAGYGFQWRHFGADYINCETPPVAGDGAAGYDQIKEILRQLKHEPSSRRIVLSAWNPAALDRMALPPCHVLCQFYVSGLGGEGSGSGSAAAIPRLSCHMYQRSQDVFLGAPFNIFSYTALTYLLAKMSGMTPGELIISTGDTHIYKDHIESMKIQMRRMPLAAPRLTVHDRVLSKTIDDITIDDFELNGYFYHPRLYGKMSV